MLFATRKSVGRRIGKIESRIQQLTMKIDSFSMSVGRMDSLLGKMPELQELTTSVSGMTTALEGAVFGLVSGQVTPREVAARLPNFERALADREVLVGKMVKAYDRARFGRVKC
ncbi:MAG: hypothetical protein ABIO85_10745 [Sphingomicrobium sp.]